jgi:hypothetical protein
MSRSTKNPDATRPRACVQCSHRKVRCDRSPSGCYNCIKARADCVYTAPRPPRRQKKTPGEVELLARLAKYEEVLAGLGVSVVCSGGAIVHFNQSTARTALNEVDASDANLRSDASPSRNGNRQGSIPTTYGRLVRSGESSSYLSNHLWTSLYEVRIAIRSPSSISRSRLLGS